MKDMLRSKTIILFVVMVLGISIMAPTNKLEEKTIDSEYVYTNVK